jgi:hypothetical protein
MVSPEGVRCVCQLVDVSAFIADYVPELQEKSSHKSSEPRPGNFLLVLEKGSNAGLLAW